MNENKINFVAPLIKLLTRVSFMLGMTHCFHSKYL